MPKLTCRVAIDARIMFDASGDTQEECLENAKKIIQSSYGVDGIDIQIIDEDDDLHTRLYHDDDALPDPQDWTEHDVCPECGEGIPEWPNGEPQPWHHKATCPKHQPRN